MTESSADSQDSNKQQHNHNEKVNHSRNILSYYMVIFSAVTVSSFLKPILTHLFVCFLTILLLGYYFTNLYLTYTSRRLPRTSSSTDFHYVLTIRLLYKHQHTFMATSFACTCY